MKSALSPADRERLEELFDQASELPSIEHAAFMERHCGDNLSLREHLARLLAGMAGEDILGKVQPLAPSRVGTSIRPYELLELLGEGGMGEVYLAQQQFPVKRRVALKVIKAGMDSAQVIRRFEMERQALALMEHPNISRILDAGTTEDARPYFVMEHVEGGTIGKYCDEHRLSTRKRLELFLQLCEGVQHAHQKGVIHRDLKLSNLLVMVRDGRAVPKIIDFGVARAVSDELGEHSLHTSIGTVVGTLDYMSPEQADQSGAPIDTRSDIYSLGVVLYQLLSGFLPFEQWTGTDVPLAEAQRVLREEDPVTPSTRLRRHTGTATTIAPMRGTTEQGLFRQLSGDLDWICLKALEKDPERRYQSASELAADLRRHLTHVPVLAGRPGKLYLLRKFVRRHRLGVAAAALIAVSAAAAMSGVISGKQEAESQARIAEAEKDKFLRVSDGLDLDALQAHADELWPPYPEMIPEYEAWTKQANALFANWNDHEATLREVRGRAEPVTEALLREDRQNHPLRAELESSRAQLEWKIAQVERGKMNPAMQLEAERLIESLEMKIPGLERRVQERTTWILEDKDDRWWHRTLIDLLERMDHIEATLMAPNVTTLEHGWSIPKRIEVAQGLQEGFAPGGAYRMAWERDLEPIRAAYDLPDFVPQMGLIPLGPDPGSGMWEFADLLSGTPPERDPVSGELVLFDTMSVVLVLLPGGTFIMGAQRNNKELETYDERAIPHQETPPHPVSVEPFFISKYELTRSQWWLSTHAGPVADMEDPDPNPVSLLPASNMNWFEANTYTHWLGLCLPHEEQWEYAARAGTTTIWSTGEDDELSIEEYANLFDQTGAEERPFWKLESTPSPIRDGALFRTPVDAHRPNFWGLHNVHGNVAEWCGNSMYSYRKDSFRNLLIHELKVARGGSNRSNGQHARSSARRDGPGFITNASLGLRPAREISPKSAY